MQTSCGESEIFPIVRLIFVVKAIVMLPDVSPIGATSQAVVMLAFKT